MSKIKELEKDKVVPCEVMCSKFGCMNCLWAGIECKHGSWYELKYVRCVPSCKNYSYYD